MKQASTGEVEKMARLLAEQVAAPTARFRATDKACFVNLDVNSLRCFSNFPITVSKWAISEESLKSGPYFDI
ncbi:hypothetical protein [Almyronema epifaneia]|uniref:Uncharacterized protein n=1 Tax=Almyronema epifaneia S1 TaxID=2991925 RepID=A0ABW6IAG0_9CYAN